MAVIMVLTKQYFKINLISGSRKSTFNSNSIFILFLFFGNIFIYFSFYSFCYLNLNFLMPRPVLP